MLILTTLSCLLLSLWVNALQPIRDQQAALAVVNRLNGASRSEAREGYEWWRWLVERVIGEGAFISVIEVDLREAQFARKEAGKLAGLDCLQVLLLDKSSITDTDLTALGSMPDLETLGLRYCNISDQGFARLGGKPNLKELYLTGCDISDESIERLASYQSLELLMVRWTRLSPAGVEELAARLPACTVAYQPRMVETEK